MIFETIFVTIGTKVLEEYGTSLAGKSIAFAKEKWAEFNWKDAAETYRKNLYQQYSTVRILGKSQPVPLEGIFTDVYPMCKAFKKKVSHQGQEGDGLIAG